MTRCSVLILSLVLFLAAKPPGIRAAAAATAASSAPSAVEYVAIYLGPTYLTSAYCPCDGDKPIKIAKVEANGSWQAWALERALADSRHQQSETLQDEGDYDPKLLAAFLPTLQQISQATTAKLQRPYEIYFIVLSHPAGMTGRNTMIDLIRNSTDPDSNHFTDPPLPTINILDRSPFVRASPMALMAYNLTTPEAWAARPGHQMERFDRWPFDGFKDDDDFALLVNFEPQYLELAFECSDWGCEKPVRALYTNLGENALFNGATNWNVTSAEWNNIIATLSLKMSTFVKENIPGPQPGSLRIVTFLGGISLMANDAMQIALTRAFPELELWRLKSDLDPAYVPSLGAALEARREVEWNRMVEKSNELYPLPGLAEIALLGTWPTSAREGFCNWYDYYRLMEV